MGSTNDYRIDYNGLGEGKFQEASGIYTAEIDPITQGSATILFVVIRSGFSSTLKIKGKILQTSLPDDPAPHD